MLHEHRGAMRAKNNNEKKLFKAEKGGSDTIEKRSWKHSEPSAHKKLG
jgi:hypothetical protein